ncbi:MAG: 50S ribosomal protein L3 N(5)-glutamine methyltransferase [Acidiferrobacteraceae bacterium]|nr:50S ribosomal protein L3 N(5)-glutamine methyltransferase [Acidiferrobacteraceae bacterium]|tara:strand:+ start:4447 stop:5349 length:903 start_codon:yes stop_codon:yes gene_type:complete
MQEVYPKTIIACIEYVEKKFTDSRLFFGHGTTNAHEEASWLVMSVTELEEITLEIEQTFVVQLPQYLSIEKLAELRIMTRKPLAYLLGESWFSGHKFYIDERVIVPRSHIGEHIRDRFHPWLGIMPIQSALDLCTGSGCIAVAMALAFCDITVDAVDISVEALDVARKNIERYSLDKRVRLFQGDLFDALTPLSSYDLIVCNPPYVSTQIIQDLPPEYRFEPAVAFDGGADGLDIVCRILRECSKHLTNSGRLFMELGSAAMELEEKSPKTPFTWLTSSNGESAVLTLTKQELIKIQERF